ncbi:molybdopterin converting factor subunit 1 [Alteromonas sp. 5E99-2]|uniref:molybdopterin converting factor subunit 1 n=1 Tax=Alteromonas sp. 5E99-2 TaxID=2817683 RepID=UPI001A99154B|nr:molybdopterin converting factor subunit 1 [Alteromonas sp. 5E99-2]MBO1255618.1 molybdopterin converting factor subunit 1 [Alteromonas sp. 5E99-2]
MTENKNTVIIKFFALVREQIGLDEITETITDNETLDELKRRIEAKGDNFALALSGPVVMACNQTMVDGTHTINYGDEIAFFPPVTGG